MTYKLLSVLDQRTLIEPSGKLEAPGRPTIYKITNQFLNHFGLKDLKDLKISNIAELA